MESTVGPVSTEEPKAGTQGTPETAVTTAETGAPESFAIYFAKRLIADEQLTNGTVEEATALQPFADVMLTESDGLRFAITCIVDAEKDPEKRFSPSPEVLKAVSAACEKYCGKIFGSRITPRIRVIEIRPSIDAADRDRLRALCVRRPGGPRITAEILSVAEGRAWNTKRFGGRLSRSRARMIAAPRIADEALFAPTVDADANVDTPYLTYGILAILTAMFVAQIVFSVGDGGVFDTGVQTLLALGGLERNAVVAHREWYRLFTAPLLHGGIIHLACNALALYLGGLILELFLGRAWLLAIFFLGGLGGTLMSLRVNDPNVVSIGASGAIMALLSAAYLITRRLPRGPVRRQIQMPLLQLLIPSLIPLAFQAGEKVDYGAHFGGALTGLAIGLVLLVTWNKSSPRPHFAWAARALAAAGIVVTLWAFVQVKAHYAPYALDKLLIPAEVFAGDDGAHEEIDRAIEAKSHELVAKYPRDPRSHLYRAREIFHASKLNEPPRLVAEEELRVALADRPMLDRMEAHYDDSRIEGELREWLVALLLDRNADEEARAAAAPLCENRRGKTPENFLKWKVCER